MDLALDLMAEFVFCEVDRRGNKRTSPLTALSELQLLEVLFDFFNSLTSEASKNTVFLSLFSGTTAAMRSGVLSKLVSIAIGVPSQDVLIAAGTWMQQLGNTSPNSCKLAEALVKDFFVLVPSALHRLNVLPKIAPQFTANFLTAVGEIYFNENTKKNHTNFPPDCLLETVTLWVSENHKLCVAAQQTHSALPAGAIAMEATTPLAGLIKWCILAPLYDQTSNLYSQLHLSLLNSILEVPRANPPRAIGAQQLAAPIGYICRYMAKAKRSTNWELNLALDRYAQAIQVALYVSCVYGNLDDFMRQLSLLPYNKLLNIVILTHKQNK